VSTLPSSSSRPRTSAITRILRAVVLAPIVAYRTAISPALPRRCKYEPTCSRYAIDAIGSYGILRGVVLAAWRLLRCNPWSDGGYDPVQSQRVFRARAHTGG
jgi:putative membrane protein insertion efficiency factor